MGLAGLWGQPLAQLTPLQLWPWDKYLICQAWILARTPSIRCLQLCLSFQLSSTTGNCSLPSWQPSNDWLHPVWLLWACRSMNCCPCTHQRSIHTSIHGTFQLPPTWGWEIWTCVLGSGTQPCSSSYWHKLLQHLWHPHRSDTEQFPNQTHRHQCGAWKVG